MDDSRSLHAPRRQTMMTPALLIGSFMALSGCEPLSPVGSELAAASSVRPAIADLAALRAASADSASCPAITDRLGPSLGSLYHASSTSHGSGLSAAEPARLDQVLYELSPGDTVVLQPGDYGHLVWPSGLNGHEGAPITLKAEHKAVTVSGNPPDLVATPIAEARRTNLSLELSNAEFIRIEGIYGRIEVEDSREIELAGNHHFENEAVNLQLWDSSSVSVHHSLFENYRLKPGDYGDWHTDYGLAAYIQTRLAVHHNVFKGGFNHAISLKEHNHDVTISCNRFTDCGRHCLELGQQTDGRPPDGSPIDRTSSRVLIQSNLIEKRDDELVNADFAVMIMNIDEIEVTRNRFVGFDHSLLVSSYWAPSNCSDQGETMSQIGVEPSFVSLIDNEFIGATNLRITGRGVLDDRVEIGGVKGGPVSCELRTLTPITCDDACCIWDPPPATEAPPSIMQLDSSLSCVPES